MIMTTVLIDTDKGWLSDLLHEYYTQIHGYRIRRLDEHRQHFQYVCIYVFSYLVLINNHKIISTIQLDLESDG